jgi:hypothetical protein
MQQQIIFNRTIPPKIEDVKIYFSQRGMPDREAEHFFLFYEKRLWKSKKGRFLKSWKNIAWNWISSVLHARPWLFNKNVH